MPCNVTALNRTLRPRRAGGPWATSRLPSRTHATSGRCVWLDGVQQDVRAAVRGLRKSAGFSAVVIGTLALGIGANTSLFSIFNSLIMRPLPVRDPGSLALLADGSWSYPVWQEIATRAERPVRRRLRLVSSRASTSRRTAALCPWTAPTSAGASSTCSACRHSAAGCSHQPTTAPPRRAAPSRSSAIASGASTSAAPMMSWAANSRCRFSVSASRSPSPA